jgi:hypothetical protein
MTISEPKYIPDDGKITWDDGKWWQIRTEVTRGMDKALNKAAIGGIAPAMRDGDASLFEDPEALKQQMISKMDEVSLSDRDDAMLLVGTIASNLFEGDPSVEVFDELPKRYVNDVLSIMKREYDEEDDLDLEEQPPPS